MALVDVQAAAALGTLFRDRWRRATGHQLAPPAAADVDVAADVVVVTLSPG